MEVPKIRKEILEPILFEDSFFVFENIGDVELLQVFICIIYTHLLEGIFGEIFKPKNIK